MCSVCKKHIWKYLSNNSLLWYWKRVKLVHKQNSFELKIVAKLFGFCFVIFLMSFFETYILPIFQTDPLKSQSRNFATIFKFKNVAFNLTLNCLYFCFLRLLWNKILNAIKHNLKKLTFSIIFYYSFVSLPFLKIIYFSNTQNSYGLWFE